MQQIQFYREGIRNYMLLPCEAFVDRDAYGTALLELLSIPGFMQYEIRVLDEKLVLYYKLKYRTSLKQVLGDVKLTLDMMNGMLASIVEVLNQTEDYLLNPEFIMWRSDTTFVEVNSGKLLFAYYPAECDWQKSLKDFLIELIQYVDKKDERVYMHVMEFYNLITNPDCDLDQLKQFVKKRKYGSAIEIADDFVDAEDVQAMINDCNGKKAGDVKNDIKTGEKMAVFTKEKKEGKLYLLTIGILTLANLIVVFLLLLEIWTYQYIWVLAVTFILLLMAFLMRKPFGEEKEIDEIMEEYLIDTSLEVEHLVDKNKISYDDEIEASDETTILFAANQEVVIEDKPQELYLKSMNPKCHRDLIMDKTSMVIGSLNKGCDYLLSEKGISRMHTKLIKKEDGLYALDMNSTNQTYLNEQPLISGKEYLLNEGDVLSLAGVVTFVVVEREC